MVSAALLRWPGRSGRALARNSSRLECAAGQGGDDLLDFGGDDVAAGEVGVVEDLAEDALGEEVLDEHLLDGVVGEVGIDGLAAEGVEVLEAWRKAGWLRSLSMIFLTAARVRGCGRRNR